MPRILLLVFLLWAIPSMASSAPSAQHSSINTSICDDGIKGILSQMGNDFFNAGQYREARECFEKLYAESDGLMQKNSVQLLNGYAARMLANLNINGYDGQHDYCEALKYASWAYTLAKYSRYWAAHKPSSHENADQFRPIYALAASDVGRIYKEGLGPTADYRVAFQYYEEAYCELKSLNRDALIEHGANVACELGEIYTTELGFDNDHEKATALFSEVLALGQKCPAKYREKAEYYLKTLQPQNAVDIIAKDGSCKKIDLSSKTQIKDTPGPSLKSFKELFDSANENGTDLIIAKVMILNEGTHIGSFYGEVKPLIHWLWGPKAPEVFTMVREEKLKALDDARKKQLKDGRRILEVRFFRWNKKSEAFEYLFNNKDLFDGYEGRLKRLLLRAQDFHDVLGQAVALFSLGEMYFLGIGGPKNLDKAEYCLDIALEKNLNLAADAAMHAKRMRAAVWLEKGIDLIRRESDSAIKYLQKVSEQSDNFPAQVQATICLAMSYQRGFLVKQDLSKALLNIRKVLSHINILPPPVLFMVVKMEQDVETELNGNRLQALAALARTGICSAKCKIFSC